MTSDDVRHQYDARVAKLARTLSEVAGEGAKPSFLITKAELRALPQVQAKKIGLEGDPEELTEAIFTALKDGLRELTGGYTIFPLRHKPKRLSANNVRFACETLFSFSEHDKSILPHEMRRKAVMEKLEIDGSLRTWRSPSGGEYQIMRILANQLLTQKILSLPPPKLSDVEVTYFLRQHPAYIKTHQEQVVRADVIATLEVPEGTHTYFVDTADYLWFWDQQRMVCTGLYGCQDGVIEPIRISDSFLTAPLRISLTPPATKGSFKYSYRADTTECKMLADCGSGCNSFRVTVQPWKRYRSLKLNLVAEEEHLTEFSATAYVETRQPFDIWRTELGPFEQHGTSCLSYTFDNPAPAVWISAKVHISRDISCPGKVLE